MPHLQNSPACPHHSAPSPIEHEALTWKLNCPEELEALLIPPRHFERQEDRSAQALKVRGFDHGGHACYYRHHYVIEEERFDEDELPLRIETYREQVIAWRLRDGRWLQLSWRASGAADCSRRLRRRLRLLETEDDIER